jgi:hypothetical protein
VYHGRIIVPPEYPMKPPDIIVLTVSLFLMFKNLKTLSQCSGSGIRRLFDPGIWDELKTRFRVPHFQELRNNFWVKILQFFDADPGWKKFGYGMEISDPG